MKPFDLEAAMRGEPLITRDGKTAKFIVCVPEAPITGNLVALLAGEIFVFTESGRYYVDGTDSLYDLFMQVPEYGYFTQGFIDTLLASAQFMSEEQVRRYAYGRVCFKIEKSDSGAITITPLPDPDKLEEGAPEVEDIL